LIPSFAWQASIDGIEHALFFKYCETVRILIATRGNDRHSIQNMSQAIDWLSISWGNDDLVLQILY
jgi:hypothetical protein